MKKRKNIAVIALGGAGNTILNTLIKYDLIVDDPNNQALHVNFSISDLGEDFKGNKVILSGDGTGRNQTKGEEIVKEKRDILQKNYALFYQKVKKYSGSDDITFIILASLGGGSGSSLAPFTIDYFNDLIQKDDSNSRVAYVGIVSSPKEGVVTLPNCIKSFNKIYNSYVRTEKIKSCFLIDNRKFEKDYGLATYDYSTMNDKIVEYLSEIFDEESYRQSAAGFQTLDVNEVRRVIFWGKGVADFSAYDFAFSEKEEDGTIEVKPHSSIFGGNHKRNTAKAVSCFVQVKKKDFELSADEKKIISETIQKFRKKFANSFFVFGFNFANKNINKDFRFRVIVNGMDYPGSFESDVNKAAVAVEKIKKENHDFEIKQDANLDF